MILHGSVVFKQLSGLAIVQVVMPLASVNCGRVASQASREHACTMLLVSMCHTTHTAQQMHL
eukprot:11203050-Lingulodinium_polyedra.AAC.1